MEDLQARINCLVKENDELKATREVEQKQMDELKERIAALEIKLVEAWKQESEACTIAWNFKKFIGNSDDVVNKARLYDKETSQQSASLGPKIIRFLVDYDRKIEKVLIDIWEIYNNRPEQALEQPAAPVSTPP